MHLTASFIITLIIVGLIIGALGRLVVPGRNPMGILATILVGIVGAFVGGLIAAALHASLIIAILLEVLVAALLVYFISGRSTIRA